MWDDDSDDYSPEFDGDDRDPDPDPDPQPEPDDDYWDDDPRDGVEREPREPNCFGCYDSGFTGRGRRCPGCNPTRWQRIFYGARWHVVIRPWLWLDRKLHPNRGNGLDESPF